MRRIRPSARSGGGTGLASFLFRLSGRYPASDLHDHCRGIAEHVLRKVIKTPAAFPTEQAALKCLFGAAERRQSVEFCAGLARGPEALSDSLAGADAVAGARMMAPADAAAARLQYALNAPQRARRRAPFRRACRSVALDSLIHTQNEENSVHTEFL